MIAIATLLIIVMLSVLVTRVASVALILTGMSPDVARFQARSALTSTGFATAEAEQIVSHPFRRQIVFTLMLVGNAGLVTTVASLSQSFATADGSSGVVQRLGALIVGLLVLIILVRNERLAQASSQLIERLLRRYTSLDVQDYAGLLHVGMDYSVNRIRVPAGHWLAGRPLSESRLTDEGMLVLGVERSDGIYLGAPRGATCVEPEDHVLVYGPSTSLLHLHDRPAGEEGTAAHEQNVAASRAREAAEEAADRSRRGRLGDRLRRGDRKGTRDGQARNGGPGHDEELGHS